MSAGGERVNYLQASGHERKAHLRDGAKLVVPQHLVPTPKRLQPPRVRVKLGRAADTVTSLTQRGRDWTSSSWCSRRTVHCAASPSRSPTPPSRCVPDSF
jgi:hypothetical protein